MSRARCLIESESPRSVLKRLRFPVRAIDKAGLRQFLRAWGFRVRELRVGKHVATSYLTIEPKVTEDDLKSVELNLYDWLHKQNPAADWDVLLYQDFGEWDPAWGSEPKYRIKYPDLVYLRIMARRPEPVEEPTDLFGEARSPRELLRFRTHEDVERFLANHEFNEWKPGEWIYRWWPPLGQGRDIIVQVCKNWGSGCPSGSYKLEYYRLPDSTAFGNPRRWRLKSVPVSIKSIVPQVMRLLKDIGKLREEV